MVFPRKLGFFSLFTALLLGACGSKTPTEEDIKQLLLTATGSSILGNSHAISPYISDLEIANVECSSKWAEDYLKFERDKSESVDVWTCYYDIIGVTWVNGKAPGAYTLDKMSLQARAIVSPLKFNRYEDLKNRKIVFYWWDDKWNASML